jgi:hypothetical protein
MTFPLQNDSFLVITHVVRWPLRQGLILIDGNIFARLSLESPTAGLQYLCHLELSAKTMTFPELEYRRISRIHELQERSPLFCWHSTLRFVITS